MRLYLIRHGQSTNNALGTDIGRTDDPPLTDLGHKQAHALARHLAEPEHPESNWEKHGGYHFDHLYCSAMHRALQTTAPVAKALNLQPEVWVDVHEQGGLFLDQDDGARIGTAGLTMEAIQQQFPGFTLPDTVTSAGWWNRDFETEAAAAGRATAVVEQLVDRSIAGDQSIAIVAHGYFMNLLIKAMFNQLPSPNIYYHHYNTGITRVDITEAWRFRLRYLNRVGHLSPDLVSP
jgi:broad specificity phosphatase PhoE